MRIGYNARLLASADLRGWNRYTINLISALTRIGVEPVLYADRPIHPDHLDRLDGAEVRVSPPMSYDRWEQIWLSRQARRDSVAALHSPFNFGLPWSTTCPRVLTLHDAIDQVYHRRSRAVPSLNALRDRLRHRIARTRAHRIITVSDHARGDLIRHLGIPAEKIVVIHEAADPRFNPEINADDRAEVLERYGLRSPYIFYVGGWERRKNVSFLVRAFAEAAVEELELVLAGGRDEQRESLIEQARSLGVIDRVRLIGFVADADLPALYAGSLGFVYPSEYEGFGLQLCEAMAMARPVLAARATSLPEVLGDGGETFPLDSTAPLAAMIRRLATDLSYRDELACLARSRSTAFSWDRTAAATLAVYRELGAK